MGRFFGKIGFAKSVKTSEGVWEDSIEERSYYGDIIKNTRRWNTTENLNDNLEIKNEFSIIADSFCYQNIGAMRYITYMGTSWKINTAEINHPRIDITVGGVYNGPKPPEIESNS